MLHFQKRHLRMSEEMGFPFLSRTRLTPLRFLLSLGQGRGWFPLGDQTSCHLETAGWVLLQGRRGCWLIGSSMERRKRRKPLAIRPRITFVIGSLTCSFMKPVHVFCSEKPPATQ